MRIRTLFPVLVAVLLLALLPAASTTAQTPDPVWIGEYYNNAVLGEPLVFSRSDSDIAFDWGLGSPGEGIAENTFSVRWSTDVFLNAGTYRFWVLADDNVSVTVDFNRTIIDTFDTNEVDKLVAADIELDTGSHHIQVDYREVVDQAFAYVDFANLANNPDGPDFPVPQNPSPTGAWTARYFTNANLAGSPAVIRGETQVGGNWGSGSPLPAIPNDNWSAEWSTNLTLDGGEYRINASADDGVRVFVDGILVIDEWHVASGEQYSVLRSLARGSHSFTVQFYEAAGLAFLNFSLEGVNVPPTDTNYATVTTGRLNVRDIPDPFTGNILTRINNGETYPALTRTADASWVKINAIGVIGWVNASYVFVPDILSLPVEGSDAQPTGYSVTATPYTVNIRTGPGTQFDDIGNLPDGETAQVIGRNASATWWQINYEDIVGWVSAQYAIIESGAELSQIPVTQ